MENSYDAKYSKLSDSELEALGTTDGEPLLHKQPSTYHPPQRHRKWLVIQGLLLVANLTMAVFLFGVHLESNQCPLKIDSHSPLAGKVPEVYENVTFTGNFVHQSPYRGKPTDEMIAAWDDISEAGSLRLSEEEFRKMNLVHSASSVKYSPEDGGGYMATTQVFHQLHCVKMLWKHTYIQYFPELMEAAKNKCDAYHAHLDHCADVLRQHIMCTGDTNVVTYNWVEGLNTPWPNFDVQRTCKKFGSIQQWARENEVTLKVGSHVTKTADVVEEPTLY